MRSNVKKNFSQGRKTWALSRKMIKRTEFISFSPQFNSSTVYLNVDYLYNLLGEGSAIRWLKCRRTPICHSLRITLTFDNDTSSTLWPYIKLFGYVVLREGTHASSVMLENLKRKEGLKHVFILYIIYISNLNVMIE